MDQFDTSSISRPPRISPKPKPIITQKPQAAKPTEPLVPQELPKPQSQPGITQTDKVKTPVKRIDNSEYDDYENTYDENYDQSDYNEYKPESSEPDRPVRPNIPIRYDDGSSFRENIQSPQNQQKTSIIKNHDGQNNGPSSGSHFYPDQMQNKPAYNPVNQKPPYQPSSHNTHQPVNPVNRQPHSYQPTDYERAPASQNIPVLNQFNQQPTQQQFRPPVDIPAHQSLPYRPNLPVYPSQPASSNVPVKPQYPFQPQVPLQPQFPVHPEVPVQPSSPVGTLNYNFGSSDSQLG